MKRVAAEEKELNMDTRGLVNTFVALLLSLCLLVLLAILKPLGLSSTPEEHQPMPSVASGHVEGKRVLVTGGAGFIGYHVAKQLVKNGDNIVVAMDNFNEYYDIKLKIDRAYDLHTAGVEVYHEDVCNAVFLRQLFERYNFSHVVHLAAQAGVRYSLNNPLVYVRSNVECHLQLLDLMRHNRAKLVYASSSSVYGKSSPIPFHLSANTDHPGNMYAATKRTDEIMTEHYCLTSNLSSVGLRFFTVYGPWGRPDMAVYRFAESIYGGKAVPLFHVSDDQPLGRDFTYIDDIVEGVMSALDYTPRQCGECFNLGFGNPVSVPRLVLLLERELGIKATVQKLPLPPTEILRTWADISLSRERLGFNPHVDLEAGIHKFVLWFKGYTQDRQQDHHGQTQAEDWFLRLCAEMEERRTTQQEQTEQLESDLQSDRLRLHSDLYQQMLADIHKDVDNTRLQSTVIFQDLDHCQLWGRNCPNKSKCVLTAPDQYQCQCLQPLVMMNRECIQPQADTPTPGSMPPGQSSQDYKQAKHGQTQGEHSQTLHKPATQGQTLYNLPFRIRGSQL